MYVHLCQHSTRTTVHTSFAITHTYIRPLPAAKKTEKNVKNEKMAFRFAAGNQGTGRFVNF